MATPNDNPPDAPTDHPTHLASHSELPHVPPGPFRGMWSIRYLDKLKGLRLMFSKDRKTAYQDFPDRFPPGEELPAFDLQTASGERINTGDFVGKKHVVIMTGAIT